VFVVSKDFVIMKANHRMGKLPSKNNHLLRERGPIDIMQNRSETDISAYIILIRLSRCAEMVLQTTAYYHRGVCFPSLLNDELCPSCDAQFLML